MRIEYTLRRSATVPQHPNRIREYRIRAGLSQKALAKQLGHGRGMLSAWERGRCLPNLENVLALAAKLDTLVEHLYWEIYRPSRGGELTSRRKSI